MRRFPTVFAAFALAAGLGLAGLPVLAAGGGGGDGSAGSTQPRDPTWEAAVSAVKAKDYAVAIPLLQRVVARSPDNADAYNYLGFANRKLGHLQQAEALYNKALALKPNHRGANEYLGELYLQQGDVQAAERRLAVLDQACFFGCEEYTELKEKIAEFKKTGSYHAED